jgi:hypothetical protein|nr:MAG TPA: Rad50 zinc hook motif [Caudoviricetes sp.]
MYYRECPWCGSNLDPGERCECRKRSQEQKKKILAMYKDGEDGQITMNLEDMVYGA